MGWVGAGYIGHSPLALTMTALIGVVYLAGGLELLRFQQATGKVGQYGLAPGADASYAPLPAS